MHLKMTAPRAAALAAAIVTATVCGVRAQQRGVAAPEVCRISGRVSGAGTSLPGVVITLRGGTAVQVVTSSGADGTYKLAAPHGTYELKAELTGFDAVTRPLSLDSEPCQQAVDLALTLTPRAARAVAPPRGRGAGAAGGQRFQQLAVQAEATAATAEQPEPDNETASLPLPPGFSSEASAEAIAINGSTARVDQSQLNNRLGALGRGDFALGNVDPATAQAVLEGGRPVGLPQGGFGGGGGRGAFFLGGRRGQPQRIATTVDYTLGGAFFDTAPYQLRSDVPTTQQPYTRQQFGTTIGGPLRIPHLVDASKTTNFTFGYNGSRGSSLFDQYATVPTAAMRNGDFSGSGMPLVDPATGQPFPANQIPASRLNPSALALLRYIPLPNLDGTTRNYHYSTTTASVSDAINARVTHNFTPNITAPGRFGGRGGGGPGGGGGRGGRGQQQLRRGTSVTMTAQLQYRRTDGDQANVFSTLGGTTNSTSLGVPVTLTVSRGRTLHNFNVNVSRTTSATTNRFSGVENVAGEAGLLGAGTDPFGWGVPSLSFTSITSLRDLTPSERDDRRWSAAYTFAHPVARHVLRLGGDIRIDRSSSHTETNAAGTFLFTGLYTGGASRAAGADVADFLLGLPQQASLQYGPGTVAFTGRSTSLFAQDDWRVRPNLTLNLGLRYELLWPFTEENNHLANLDVTPTFSAAAPVVAGAAGPYTGSFPLALLRTDTNNVAPRVGAAWRLRNGMIVRGGYGVSYNSGSYAAIARNLASEPPFAVSNTNIGAINRVLLLEDALAGAPLSETTNNYGVDKDYALGRVQTWNADVVRNVRQVWQVGAGYTRTTGSSLDIVRAPNRGPDGLRIPDVQPFLWQTSEGASVLNAATFRIQRRQVRGIGGSVTYTLAKSRDNSPSIGGGGGSGVVAQNDQDLNAEWGLSNFDRRQRLQATMQFDLPVGPNRRWLNGGGRMATLLANWRLTGNFLAETGTPLTPRVQGAARDVSQGLNGALRANYTGAPIDVSSPSVDDFFNTGAFTVPGTGLFGTSPRNVIIGPGTRQLDAQLSRDVLLGGTHAVTLLVRASNLLNNVNYAAIDTYVNSPTFGQVLSVKPMRSMQVNLRFRF